MDSGGLPKSAGCHTDPPEGAEENTYGCYHIYDDVNTYVAESINNIRTSEIHTARFVTRATSATPSNI